MHRDNLELGGHGLHHYVVPPRTTNVHNYTRTSMHARAHARTHAHTSLARASCSANHVTAPPMALQHPQPVRSPCEDHCTHSHGTEARYKAEFGLSFTTASTYPDKVPSMVYRHWNPSPPLQSQNHRAAAQSTARQCCGAMLITQITNTKLVSGCNDTLSPCLL